MKMLNRLIIALILIVALPSVIAGSWSGNIINSTGPLDGVNVTALLNNNTINSTLTNSTGNFKITGLGNGVYTLSFIKNGYKQTNISPGITLNNSNPSRTDLVWPTNIILENAARGNLTGKVIYNSNPLNNVKITLTQNSIQIAIVYTNSIGDYVVNDLVDGTYDIEADLSPTYTKDIRQVIINPSQTTNRDIQLNLAPSSVIGKVTYSNNPLSGVLIEILNTAYQTNTNSTGDYLINNLPSGTYTIRASKLGYNTAQTPFTAVPGIQSIINFYNLNPSICTPSTEICNGADDDCDGQTDEGLNCGGTSGGDGGGGGGGGGGCTPKWNCTEWNSCNKNGNQTRICTDLRDCFNSDNKPLEVQSCAYLECTKDSDCLSGYECSSNKCTKKIIIENKTATQETEEITKTNAITGFSILDYAKKFKDSKAATIVLAVFLGSLAGIAVFTFLRRKY